MQFISCFPGALSAKSGCTDESSVHCNTLHYTAPGPNPGTNNPFAERGGFAVDGLRQGAYVGSVYANPENDGTSIEESMEFAKVAAERPGFRAVYVIPMTDARVRQWVDTTSPQGVRTRLLTVFPRHTHCAFCFGEMVDDWSPGEGDVQGPQGPHEGGGGDNRAWWAFH